MVMKIIRKQLQLHFTKKTELTPEEIEIKVKNLEEKKNKRKEYVKIRREKLAIRKGFTCWKDYLKERNNNWAISKGFKNYSEYVILKSEKIAMERGFENSSQYICFKKHQKGESLPMDLNNDCSSYLGIHIVERKLAKLILNKIFEKVEVMSYGNRGYDSICSNVKHNFIMKYFQFKIERYKKYKIDIKSRCLGKDGGYAFPIRKNKTPDYFMMFAFDNRINLNLLYIWLIKCDELINNRYSTNRKLNDFIVFNIINTEKSINRYKKYEITEKLDKIKSIYNDLENEEYNDVSDTIGAKYEK